MSEHKATINWKKETDAFTYETYNRDHSWNFKGENQLKASAAPAYKGSANRVDPEDAFVASMASCHMLTFLALASMKKLVVESYIDNAVGYLEKNEAGKLAITRVVLHPAIKFGAGVTLSNDELMALHDRAHHECFIANSVTTQVSVEPA